MLRSNRSSSVRFALSSLALLALPIAGQAATNRMVPSTYPNIQAAINAAASGDTIILGEGIYSGSGNVNIDTLGKALTIKSAGGAGTAILDGSYANPFFYIHSGETSKTKIMGLTFRYGYAAMGGAMTITNSSPTISGCEFYFNQAYSGQGGAVVVSGGAPVLTGCTFYFNASINSYGGALVLSQDKSVISNCTFDSNAAYNGYYGGALYANVASAAKITNCLFENNSAGAGGAVLLSGASPSFANCTFSENKVSIYGGALFATNSASKLNCCVFDTNTAANAGGACYLTLSANLNILNSDFNENNATTGGAIYLDHSSPTINGCEFDNNSASSQTRFTGGGALFIATYSGASSPKINDSEFDGNYSADDGGAITNYGNPVITASIFTNNYAVNDGGAIFATGSNLDMVNSIFTTNNAVNGGAVSLEPGNGGYLYMTNCSTYGNSASSNGGLGNGVYVGGASTGLTIYNTILWDAGSGNSEVYDAQHVTTISFSDVYGIWTGAGTNDFTSDPLYTDPAHNNLLPQTSSVCNNNGTPKAPLFPKTDIDGVTRSTTTPDIGAYEF